MRIGIDVSQLAYTNTGVATYLDHLIQALLRIDEKNTYVLFFSSLRRQPPLHFQGKKNAILKRFYFPPSILDLLWNRLHTLPIESLIGDIDIFIASDWTQPPVKRAKLATVLYDVIIYTYPQETDQKIVATQKRKLHWVKKECDLVLCISEATKRDAKILLGISENKLKVVYPGLSL